MFWKPRIVIREDPIEADQAFDVLTNIFPPEFEIEVFYMSSRKQHYYRSDVDYNRTLYIRIEGPDIELKLRGKTFRDILTKLSPVIVNNLDQKQQEKFNQELLSFSSQS